MAANPKQERGSIVFPIYPASFLFKSWRRDLNPRPTDYKSVALPAELRQPAIQSRKYSRVSVVVPWCLISCQQMIFKKSQRNNIPCEAEPSIYSVISNNARFGPVESIDLPDDQRFAISERLLWSAGAADGVFTHHVDLKMDEKLAGIAMSHLLEITKLNRISDKVQLYAVLRSNHVISFLDYLLGKLQETDIDLEALHDTAKWLTTETPDREPVKLKNGHLTCVSSCCKL